MAFQTDLIKTHNTTQTPTPNCKSHNSKDFHKRKTFLHFRKVPNIIGLFIECFSCRIEIVSYHYKIKELVRRITYL